MILQLLYLTLFVQSVFTQTDQPKFYFSIASGSENVILEETATDNTVLSALSLMREQGGGLVSATVVLDTTCPADCPIPSTQHDNMATEEPGGDYTLLTKNFNFDLLDERKIVPITIKADDEEEFKEYFCLRIADPAQRGTQGPWFVRVIIPWNDHCVPQLSIFDEGNDKRALGYFINHDIVSVVSHVGPWDLTEAPSITLKVEPQSPTDNINNNAGDGNNLNIYVSNRADINNWMGSGSFMWYGIHLDDEYANDHYSGGTTLDSWIDNGALTRDPFSMGSLLGTAQTTAMVAHGQNEYTLTVGTSGTPVSLQKVGGPLLTGTGGSLAINNLFVTAANDNYAAWEICGLEPRRLPIIGAKPSGHHQNFAADLAVDNLIWYTSCFRSEPDSDGKNWLQIDMGAEFLVKKVVIYPMHYGEDLPLDLLDPKWLNNMGVYVGSCREEIAVTTNNPCKADIGLVAQATGSNLVNTDQKLIIDVDCDANAIGRYVYITPQADGTLIGFCEVRLFGSDVPTNDETKVLLSATAEAIEGAAASVAVTQLGVGRTCSYIQYHTDRAVNNDFEEAYPSKEAVIVKNGNAAISILTNDDKDCEGDETFNVYLDNIDGGVLSGSTCTATVTIKDHVDDKISFTLAHTTADPTVAEGHGTLSFTVGHSGGADQVASASVVFTSGSATLPQDFSTAVAQDATFPTSPQTVSVQIQDDNCYEADETFQVTLSHLQPSCSDPPTNIPITMTITDNDSQFQFSYDGLTMNILDIIEGETKTASVLRTGTLQLKTVNFTETFGSATTSDVTLTPSSKSLTFNPSTGTAEITIVAADDAIAEEREVFQLSLIDPNGAGCLNNIGINNNLIVRIFDNDFKYEFERPSSTDVSEGDQVEICLNRVCPDPSNLPATMVAIEGQPITAIASDYTITSPVSIPAGQNRGCVNMQIVTDSDLEPAEVFNVIIAPQQTGVDGGDSLTFTIFDTAGMVRFQPVSYAVTEGTSQVSLTVVHTSTAPVEIRVFTEDGSAIAGSDYTSLDQVYTIPGDQPSRTIPISILNDGNVENSEQFTARLESTNAQVTDALATITIDDNDVTIPPPPRPRIVIGFTIIAFRGVPAVFTNDLNNPTSPAFLDLSLVIIAFYRPIFLLRIRGFFSLRVLRFRPGSVIADFEITLMQNSTTPGMEVIEVIKTEDTPEEIFLDLNSLVLLAEVCPTGYCNNGTCAANDDDTGSVCTCNKGYSGERCQNPGSGGSSSLTTTIIVVNVVLWTVVAILIGACYYMQMRKSKEQKLNEPPQYPYPNQYNRALTSFTPSSDSPWALAPLQ